MSKLKITGIMQIEKEVKSEFPDDPALQQVHIARKIIAREEKKGLSFIKYIKSLRNSYR